MTWPIPLAVFCCVLAAGPLHAQAPAASLDLREAQGQLLIPVTIDHGRDTLHFLFDSGCEVNVLSMAARRRLGLDSSGEAGISGWRNEMTMVPRASARSLELGGTSLPYPSFYLQDLGGAGVDGLRVDGIIGYELLRRYVVELDYAGKKMILYRPGHVRYPPGGQRLALSLNYKTPLVQATLLSARGDSLQGEWHVISGGRFGLLINDGYLRAHRLAEALPRSGQVTRPDLLLPVTYTACRVPAFWLGKERLDAVEALYAPQVDDSAPDRQIAGAIGAGVWSRFRLYIDLPGKTLYLLRP